MKSFMYACISLIAALVLLSTACKQEIPLTPTIDTPAGELPLLSPGKHVSFITGFNPSQSEATGDSIQARWDEALQRGMSVGRLQIDWPELEPEEGQFAPSELEDQLKEMEAKGLQCLLTISAYDSDGPVVPSYLDGKAFDSRNFINRFNLLMDWVIPMLADHQGWAIAIANEPEVNFEDQPKLGKQIHEFLRQVRKHIHQINPDMAVTITMAEGSLDQPTEELELILAESDVACWNFYGGSYDFANLQFNPQNEAEIQADIDRLLEVSGEKMLIFQELGSPANEDQLGSSEEIQRAFFETFFTRMEQEERLRAAYVFQLVDWSPETLDVFLPLLEGEGIPQKFIDDYGVTLASLGLIQYTDGKRRPAWNECMKWLEKFK